MNPLLSGNGELPVTVRQWLQAYRDGASPRALLVRCHRTALQAYPPTAWIYLASHTEVGAQLALLEGGAPPLQALAVLHAQLSKVVAPAMPVTLQLLSADRAHEGIRAILGPIANVRRLMLAAILLTAMFVAISVSPVLNKENMAGDLYTLMGQDHIVVMAFLLSAAGIGAAFQALFTAQRYVASATYEPRYDSSYWIRIVLGFVSGLLLAVLIPLHLEGDSSMLAKPVLALLGGFSAGLVYRILQRMVDAVESMFQPSAKPGRPEGSG